LILPAGGDDRGHAVHGNQARPNRREREIAGASALPLKV
jgi:hypothetical protein